MLFAIFYEEKFVYSSEMEIWIYTLNTQTFPTFLVDDSCTKPLYRNNTSNETHIVPSGICGHHGKCHPLRDGKFRCSCDLGLTGERCETGKYFIKTLQIRNYDLCFTSRLFVFLVFVYASKRTTWNHMKRLELFGLSDYEKHLVLFLHFFKDLAHHVLLLFTVLFHLWFGTKIFLKSFVYQSLQGIVCSRLLCLLSFRHRWLCEQRLSEPWDMHGRWGGISLHLQGRLRGEVLSDGP